MYEGTFKVLRLYSKAVSRYYGSIAGLDPSPHAGNSDGTATVSTALSTDNQRGGAQKKKIRHRAWARDSLEKGRPRYGGRDPHTGSGCRGRYSVYLLYWHKSTNTDAEGSPRHRCGGRVASRTRAQFFTGTKVQILTQKAVRDIAAADVSLRELELGAAGVVEIVSALILANAHGRQVVPSLLAVLVLVQKYKY